VRGTIDRVDRMDDGSLRIIDYKTGTTDYKSKRGLEKGHKLQIALYGLAVQQQLEMGDVSDGLYFFVHKAEPADWSLATYGGGVDEAFATAVGFAWEAVQGARKGEFRPSPPEGGCPAYCPAAAFCWHYSPAAGW
jgi:hypothetical protein